ncbi:hypothetical protein [Hymenobacter edaphi]|uniref:Uncharacterized protein n=1 Tax=Hymenobacter edaphi TaxID=2211146 RepID=A0A328BJD9_9BACT|nr:hypothetical protein [Hymenobacter edaphi]RAK66034.1 hypothetical protein DLM85_15130 [Hymenobacter edaphi]
MNTTTIPGIITQEQFDTATEQWREAVGTHNVDELQQGFAQGGQILSYVSFPINQITKLISTVGIHKVKAKFGLIPDAATGVLHFAVILFAADIEGARISSYYVNASYWGGSSPVRPLPNAKVPNSLAQVWLDNWHGLTQIEPNLFEVYNTTLEGYTFDAEDFIRPFFNLQVSDQSALRVYFGLHQYYQSGPSGDAETRTLGLVLQLYSVGQPSEPYFDISMPCPKTC